MRKNLALGFAILLVCSCSTPQSTVKVETLLDRYPKLYEERPMSIVIMPPINQTNNVEAKEYFYTTLYSPLCEKGYYVFSPMMTMEMFQSESAYDAEQFIEADLSKFRQVLGADAAMFTIIKKWDRDKVLGELTTSVEFVLRSTKTGETLYRREGDVTLDIGDGVDIQSLKRTLVNLAMKAIKTAKTDMVVAARACTSRVLVNMPEGKYGSMYDKDQGKAVGDSIVKAIIDVK